MNIIPVDVKKLVYFKRTRSEIKTNSTNLDVDICTELANTLSDTTNLLHDKKCSESIEFILWNNFWNQYGIYGSKRDISRNRNKKFHRYVRGRKVFVDFGTGNIGKETSLPHPAFILYNFTETAIVVPTTSDDGSTFTPEMEKALIRCPKDGCVFPEDTIINLHQIRAIGKNRIISDLNCSSKDYILPNCSIDNINKYLSIGSIPYGTDLKKCLELKFSELISPDVYFKMVKLEQRVKELENIISQENT